MLQSRGGLQPIAQLPSIFQNIHKEFGTKFRFYSKFVNMAKKQREMDDSSDSAEVEVDRVEKPYVCKYTCYSDQ